MKKQTVSDMNETSLDFAMTDLEERLTGVHGAAAKREVIELLAGKMTDLSELMSGRLGPDGLRSAKQIHAGLMAAKDILTHFPVESRENPDIS